MKTIYIDTLGLYPWFLMLFAGLAFWRAYDAFAQGDGNGLGLSIASGTLFLIFALKRFWDVREAKRKGRDPSIIWIKNDR